MKIIDKFIKRIRYLNLKRIQKKSNKIILGDQNRKIVNKSVNLHWYSLNQNGKENLGDYLANPIFEYMLKTNNIHKEKKLHKTVHLYTVGSILFFGYQNAVVWGSGFLNDRYEERLSEIIKYDIRLVRGPKTRQLLLNQGYFCPEVYSDPALIMPLIYEPKNSMEKTRKYSVILHMKNMRKVTNQIDILTTNYKEFIDEIVKSEKIISESLHGIILAEAYGVPAILLENSDRNDYSTFKYDDYYYSTGRKMYPRAKTIEDAIEMQPISIPDFTKIQNIILNSFPTDLWK